VVDFGRGATSCFQVRVSFWVGFFVKVGLKWGRLGVSSYCGGCFYSLWREVKGFEVKDFYLDLDVRT